MLKPSIELSSKLKSKADNSIVNAKLQHSFKYCLALVNKLLATVTSLNSTVRHIFPYIFSASLEQI